MTFPGEVFFSYVFELCFYLKERQKERDGGREEKEEAERVSDSGSLFDCLQWLGSSWDEPRSGVRNSVCLLYGWQAPGHSEPLMLLSPSTCISRKADWGTGVKNWILVFHYEPWFFNWCFISRLTIHSCCRNDIITPYSQMEWWQCSEILLIRSERTRSGVSACCFWVAWFWPTILHWLCPVTRTMKTAELFLAGVTQHGKHNHRDKNCWPFFLSSVECIMHAQQGTLP